MKDKEVDMRGKKKRKFNIDAVRSSYIDKEGRIVWVPCIKTVNDPELTVEKKVDILIEETKLSTRQIAGSFEALIKALNKDLKDIWKRFDELEEMIIYNRRVDGPLQ